MIIRIHLSDGKYLEFTGSEGDWKKLDFSVRMWTFGNSKINTAHIVRVERLDK